MLVSFEEACAELLPALQRNFPVWRSDASCLTAANLHEIALPAYLDDTVAAWHVPFKKTWRRGLLSLVLVKGSLDTREHIGLAWHLAFSSTSEPDPLVDFAFLEGLAALPLNEPLSPRKIQDLVDAMLACAPAQVLAWTQQQLSVLKSEHLVVIPE